jgi:hypothetical protein
LVVGSNPTGPTNFLRNKFMKNVNCLAGEVNHNFNNKLLKRGECLFNCGCTEFIESKLPRKTLEELLVQKEK